MKITVLAVSNLGVEVITSAVDTADGTTLAKNQRTPANHMVCIDVDGERVNRWDRDRIEGENRWKKTDPGEMVTLGVVRQMTRA
jgi:hypothetical protein